jgi:hypothetical protein
LSNRQEDLPICLPPTDYLIGVHSLFNGPSDAVRSPDQIESVTTSGPGRRELQRSGVRALHRIEDVHCGGRRLKDAHVGEH